jgi:hypothetical protein
MLSEHPVGFSSQGATLRGLLIRRTDSFTRAPVVVMAHGTSATMCASGGKSGLNLGLL